MSRTDDFFLEEKLTEVEDVGNSDKILAKLSSQKTEEWKEILKLNAEGIIKTQEFARLEAELNKLRKRFDSKRFLFWDKVESADERFESVRQRGKTLAIKKDDDGSLVVVEFDLPKQPQIGLFIMPPPDGKSDYEGE
jgi:hypothetical protein